MGYASRLLGLPEENPEPLQVQEPVPRPAPIPRPGAEIPLSPRRGLSYSERLLGIEPGRSAHPLDLIRASALAKPDAPTWLGRRWQDVRGKQDPSYKDLPVYDGGGVDVTTMEQAKLLGPDDEGLANIIKSNLGDRFVGLKKDANGYPIVVYRGEDGKEISAYVNRPGLDLQDVDRSVSAAIPYIAAATGAGRIFKGVGLLGQVVAQAGAGGATSLVTDAVADGMGSEQGVSLGKAGVATAAGAVGQALSSPINAIVRKFIVEPSLFNRATQKLTERGAEAARRLGIDPDDLTGKIGQEFAKVYAKTGSGAQAQAAAQTDRQFGIPTTHGQRTKDPRALMNEKNMRYGYYGDSAKRTMDDFDRAQAEAIRDAALGGTKSIPVVERRIFTRRLALLRCSRRRGRIGGRGRPEELGDRNPSRAG